MIERDRTRRKLACPLAMLGGICLLVSVAMGEPTAPKGSGGVNAPEHRGKPQLVLVSLDGFRWDYMDRYDTPALDEVARRGVRAEALVPAFPSLTFPNHYSIATGLRPGRHGLVANRFLDPATGRRYSLRDRVAVEDGWWYGGEPIWVTAETQGMATAAFYFVGTEADVAGVRPSRWRPFDVEVPGAARVDQVLAWLAEPEDTRPHLVTLYLGWVDRAGHDYGPDAVDTADAIAYTDSVLGRLLGGIDRLPQADSIYLVVVSDHGVEPYRTDAPRLVVDDVIDTAGVMSVGGGPVMYLHLTDTGRAADIRDAVNAAWEHGRALLSDEAPASWGIAGQPRFGQVILVADPGFAVVRTSMAMSKFPIGSHGWAPETKSMHGIFLATGPGLPSGRMVPPAEVTDVYPFIARALSLRPAPDLDGTPDTLAVLLDSDSPGEE